MMKKHFTLIELLTVIAVIGILAGMLLPALSSAKNKAKASNCIGQLKQVGLALHLYAGDNKNRLPDRGDRSNSSDVKVNGDITGLTAVGAANFDSLVDHGYIPGPANGLKESLIESSILSCPITQSDPDEDMQHVMDYTGVSASYAPSAHMFGQSGSNFDRFPTGALMCDGSNAGFMGKIYNFGFMLWRHGSNAPSVVNTNINASGAENGYLGSIGSNESGSGSGTANMALADGSVTTFDSQSRVTVLRERVISAKCKAADPHSSVCASTICIN